MVTHFLHSQSYLSSTMSISSSFSLVFPLFSYLSPSPKSHLTPICCHCPNPTTSLSLYLSFILSLSHPGSVSFRLHFPCLSPLSLFLTHYPVSPFPSIFLTVFIRLSRSLSLSLSLLSLSHYLFVCCLSLSFSPSICLPSPSSPYFISLSYF